MVRKSYGKMRGSRKKMTLHGKPTINMFLAEFNAGDGVCINYSTGKNIPTPKFQGITGKVVGKRGDAYEITIKDGKAKKKIFIKPEHLKIVNKNIINKK